MLRRCVALLTLMVVAAAGPALAADHERIVSFDSEIWVHDDASMTVRETIVVESRGQQIKRGIFRDLPTDYRDRLGNRVSVRYDIEEVRRGGQSEPYHSERLSNGVRIYIGDRDVLIPDGRHSYVITYRTDRQLGFFQDFDELYWNVTGNDWAFEIGRASAKIHLPEGAEVVGHAAYTGRMGEQGTAYSASLLRSGGMSFETTRPLAPGEGLTIAVAWPPGFVTRPTASDKLFRLLGDNGVLLAGVIGLGVLLAYYLIVWAKVGRDPDRGTIVPYYEPPKGFSPAAARYVTRMGFDDKAFTAAIVSMAVKGYLTIEEQGDKAYRLAKTGAAAELSAGERALARKLFSRGRSEIELKQKNHKKLRAAQKALRESLRTDFEKIYFLRNTGAFLPGVGVSLLAVAALVVAADDPVAAAFICVWLTVWSVAVYYLFRQVWRAWQAALGLGSMLGTAKALAVTLFALPFFGGELMGLGFFAQMASWGAAALLLAIQLLNLLFYHLLKAPTLLGRRVMDQIEGFAEYLSVAEKDRLHFAHPPERTPELFERFLPYALALGVEQAWSEQFSGVLSRAGESPESGGRPYHPRWYSGRRFDGGFGSLASSLGGSLAGAVAAASTAPGSSSGSGGGGSSGGGGGGGGGGGW